jgi:hypothetical protein
MGNGRSFQATGHMLSMRALRVRAQDCEYDVPILPESLVQRHYSYDMDLSNVRNMNGKDSKLNRGASDV